MKPDITLLGNAVRRLREGLARSEQEPGDEQVRDGLIQRFEFTYELSHRTLRRYLKEARGVARRDRTDAVRRFDPNRKRSGLAAQRLAGVARVS
jgi:hypothetical protein